MFASPADANDATLARERARRTEQRAKDTDLVKNRRKRRNRAIEGSLGLRQWSCTGALSTLEPGVLLARVGETMNSARSSPRMTSSYPSNRLSRARSLRAIGDVLRHAPIAERTIEVWAAVERLIARPVSRPPPRVVLRHRGREVEPVRSRPPRRLEALGPWGGTPPARCDKGPKVLGSGRYWARTSDLRLVEAALSQLS
jgi:hypothetical protein